MLDMFSAGQIERFLGAHRQPSILSTYHPGYDDYCHFTNPTGRDRLYLTLFDELIISRYINLLRSKKLFHNYIFVFLGDHGQIKTNPTKRILNETHLRPILENDFHLGGPIYDTEDLIPWFWRSAVIAANAPIAQIYLHKGGRVPIEETLNWPEKPLLDEEIFLVARRFFVANEGRAYGNILKNKLQMILVRVEEDRFEVLDTRPGTRQVIRRPIDEFLNDPRHVNLKNLLVENIDELIALWGNDEVCGEIILFANQQRGFYFPGGSAGVRFKRNHGGLSKTEAQIPFIIAYPGGLTDNMRQFLNDKIINPHLSIKNIIKVGPIIRDMLGNKN